MTALNEAVILHNYPQSPVAEKVRVALGIKGISWHSVEIPRLPPKPLLTPLTGGYRRTPVMQIGSDIYCDSQYIMRELERRFPSPSFFPGPEGELIWGLSRLTEGALFDLAVKIVLGSAGDALPRDFAEDRGRLYLGADWDEGLKAANADIPHLASQMRAPFALLEKQLSDGRSFLLGDKIALIDAQYYCLYWFLEGRWGQAAQLLDQFPLLAEWALRVKAISPHNIDLLEANVALNVARSTKPDGSHLEIDPLDPLGLTAGDMVDVMPDVDGGEDPVRGAVVGLSFETITLSRTCETSDETGDASSMGELHVHFPRDGYRVTPL